MRHLFVELSGLFSSLITLTFPPQIWKKKTAVDGIEIQKQKPRLLYHRRSRDQGNNQNETPKKLQ